MTHISDSSPAAADAAPGFSDTDVLLLERTAEAMTAMSGRPVLAEIGATDGVAWAVFGVALGTDDVVADDDTVWRMGGEGTRALGNSGGLAPRPDEHYDCRLLWVIQVSAQVGERYLKLDGSGDVVDWSDHLADLLPFGLSLADEAPWPDEDEDDEAATPGPVR